MTGRSEFALYTDARVTGQIDTGLGPAQVLNSVPAADQPRVGTRQLALVLRVEHHLAHESGLDLQIQAYNSTSGDSEFQVQTRAEAYYAGWLDDELVALASLALGIRLRSGGMTRFWRDGDVLGTPAEVFHRPPYLAAPEFERSPVIPGLLGPVELQQALPLLGGYVHLSGQVAVTLVRAARLYASAIWVAEDDPRLAWLQLVGALEAVAVHWVKNDDASPLEKLRFSWPELAELLSRCSRAIASEAADFLVPLTRAAWKLRELVRAFPPPVPEQRPEPSEQIDWTKLDRALASIYAHRSADLHGGTPIPGPLCTPPRVSREADSKPIYAERGFSGGVGIGDAVWSTDDLPMYLHVFAAITRGTLCSWWQASLEDRVPRPPSGPRGNP